MLWLVPEGLQAVALMIRSTKPACTTRGRCRNPGLADQTLVIVRLANQLKFQRAGGIGTDGVRGMVTLINVSALEEGDVELSIGADLGRFSAELCCCRAERIQA